MASVQQFTPLQRGLHWLMAACILAMFFVGVGMVSTIAPKNLGLISLHKSLGVALLILVLIRLWVRWRRGAPALPSDLPIPMKIAAQASHYLLYGLMIVMPLLGWAMLQTSEYPIVLVGGVRLPQILPQSDSLHTLFWDAHRYLAFLFFAVVLLHIAAALYHAFVRRDGVFDAMSPVSTRERT